MYFRSRRKASQDVSLSDCIETGSDGTALSLMDVVSEAEFTFLDEPTAGLDIVAREQFYKLLLAAIPVLVRKMEAR